MIAQRRNVLQLHDFEQRIFDHRQRDARRNVADSRAVLLRLLDFRVHEDRATRTEINGSLRRQCLRCKFRRGHVQALSEILYERAAPRRTRFVESDVADRAAVDEKAFHVLTADVEHETHVGTKLLRRAKMSKRLDLGTVGMDRRLHDRFAVARRKHAADLCRRRHGVVEFLKSRDHRLQRRTLIAPV